MSYSALQDALCEMITDVVENNCSFASYDHDHDGDFASYDHSHDESFEDKVSQYLDGFVVGAGCSVQRTFEAAVRAIVNAHLDSETHNDTVVRTMLRSILTNSRKLPTSKVVTILATCDAALFEAVHLHENPPVEASVTEYASNGS